MSMAKTDPGDAVRKNFASRLRKARRTRSTPRRERGNRCAEHKPCRGQGRIAHLVRFLRRQCEKRCARGRIPTISGVLNLPRCGTGSTSERVWLVAASEAGPKSYGLLRIEASESGARARR